MGLMIALLGKRDLPTDGVEDYCTFLGEALARQGICLEIVRVPWFERGWIRALSELWRRSKTWSGDWVLLQYTAIAWSRRGFPFGVAVVVKILRRRGVRTAVIFHEPFRQGGERWVDRFRGLCQDLTIRTLYKAATKAVFADPLPTVSWLPESESKASFAPIGANIPEPLAESMNVKSRNGARKTVVVFCLSDLPNRTREIGDIAHAMRFVDERGLKSRVVFLGRGTEDAKSEIEQTFGSSAIEVVNLGLQSADDVGRILSQADAMLCVRGPLYPRRGSAIAGIACGLPIVAYGGAAEGTPLQEAGVVLVPYQDRDALGDALARVLEMPALWMQLSEKNVTAYRKYFSWDVIADTMQKTLHTQTEETVL
jgi:glycosyltransferase involved in cell wall biosynthesis